MNFILLWPRLQFHCRLLLLYCIHMADMQDSDSKSQLVLLVFYHIHMSDVHNFQ